MKLLSIYTDASYIKETNDGAWAVIMVGDDGFVLKKSGAFTKIKPVSNNNAELMAIYNALYILTKEGRHYDKYCIVSDNMNCVTAISEYTGDKRYKKAVPFADGWMHNCKKSRRLVKNISHLINAFKLNKQQLSIVFTKAHKDVLESINDLYNDEADIMCKNIVMNSKKLRNTPPYESRD